MRWMQWNENETMKLVSIKIKEMQNSDDNYLWVHHYDIVAQEPTTLVLDFKFKFKNDLNLRNALGWCCSNICGIWLNDSLFHNK